MKMKRTYNCNKGCGRTRTIVKERSHHENHGWPPTFPTDAGPCTCEPDAKFIPALHHIQELFTNFQETA